MTVPAFTPSVPSGMAMSAIVPSSTASNSIVALSVSISARISPEATLSHRSEEHTSELQSLMRISYAVFCLTKKKKTNQNQNTTIHIITQSAYNTEQPYHLA